MPDMETREQRIVTTTNEAAARRDRGADERQQVARTVVGASATGALIGVGATVLGIVGLIGILPVYMAAIGTIAIGVALLLEGAAIAAKYSDMGYALYGSSRMEIGGGMSTQMLTGLAGGILGILAILGIHTFVLLPVAMIIYGAGILVGSAAPMEVESLVTRNEPETRERHMASQAVNAAHGSKLLVGIGAAVLGILALTMEANILLFTLIAVLSLGAAELIGGSALGARIGMVMSGRH